MKTLEYRTVDKAGWPRGPWDGEPDKKQWQDAATGLPCLARRNSRYGFWCGYVGIPPEHPLHGKDHEVPDADVHGGLTFAEACDGDPEDVGICHVPEPGEPEHVWWFGFDCGHAFDFYPSPSFGDLAFPGAEYRDLAYVESETTRLAEQLGNCP